MTVTIYAPDGGIGVKPVTLAPGLPTLAGRRIGVLDNGKPNAGLLLSRAAEQLAARCGAELTVVTDKGPGGNAATPCSDQVLARLIEEVDLVLTGSAD